MRVCVVGNGPSAEGRGTQIDGCDFVVRIKSFWAHGAKNAGNRIDAWAWFGADRDTAQPIPVLECEHWFTLCPAQKPSWPMMDELLAAHARESSGWARRYLRDAAWAAARIYLGRSLSTGFATVVMAIDIFRPAELLLIGFDSTTPDKPNFDNARRESGPPGPIDFENEKRVFMELYRGSWLGKPKNIALDWIGQPHVA